MPLAAKMAAAGLYRRVLPSPPAIDFSSDEGKKLFVEAIKGGTMEGFYKLISNFQTQSEPAYCGLASLSMVLNALAIDPKIRWRGPWRWFDETMLDCCEPLDKVKAEGISFGKVVCLAQCAGAEVQAFRTNETTVDQFRQLVQSSSVSDGCHVISSYHRGTFKQTGTGHFSPIGGYQAGCDMVLILDVARFKYPPHWVPLTLLWEAMDTTDPQTGRKRGFMMISRPRREQRLLYSLSCKNESWTGITKYLVDHVPNLLKSENIKDIKILLGVICESLPPDFEKFVDWIVEARRAEDRTSITKEEKGRVDVKDEVLSQAQATDLHRVVVNIFLSTTCCTRQPSSFNKEENLQNLAPGISCKGAEILARDNSSSGSSLCQEICCKCINGDDHGHQSTALRAEVVNGKKEENVDMLSLIPSQVKGEHTDSNSWGSGTCVELQPAGSAILTVLLLALPRETWSSVRNAELQQEILRLCMIENLPPPAQEEVLHLRRQLYLTKKCQENKVDEDISFSSV